MYFKTILVGIIVTLVFVVVQVTQVKCGNFSLSLSQHVKDDSSIIMVISDVSWACLEVLGYIPYYLK